MEALQINKFIPSKNNKASFLPSEKLSPLTVGVDFLEGSEVAGESSFFSQELLASLGGEEKNLKSSLQELLGSLGETASTINSNATLTATPGVVTNVAPKVAPKVAFDIASKVASDYVINENKKTELESSFDEMVPMDHSSKKSVNEKKGQTLADILEIKNIPVNDKPELVKETIVSKAQNENESNLQLLKNNIQHSTEKAAVASAPQENTIMLDENGMPIVLEESLGDIKSKNIKSKVASFLNQSSTTTSAIPNVKASNDKISNLNLKLNSSGRVGFENYNKEQNLLKDNVIQFRNKKGNEFFSKGVAEMGATGMATNAGIFAKEENLENESSNVIDLMSSKPNFSINQIGRQQSEGDSAQGVSSSKVLDLNTIKSSNVNEIIEKIADYVDKNIMNARPTLDVTVKHDSLGTFKLNATTGTNNGQVDLKIITNNEIGNEFFLKHENKLVQALNNSGIELTSVKIMSSSELLSGQNGYSRNGESSNSAGHSGRNFTNSGDGESFSQKHSENSDSQRRKNLWEEFINRKQA